MQEDKMKHTRKCLFILLAAWMLVHVRCYSQDMDGTVHRQPAVAGSFYPAGKAALEAELRNLFNEAKPAKLEGNIQSLIVPHAGYAYSGTVAASAYKSIPDEGSYKNVFVIASSHREQYNGSSVYNRGDYITPLGPARVNRDIANELIAKHKNILFYKKAHEREHSIEVQIPFIQHRLGDIPIVPIVMGSSTIKEARDLAAALLPYYTPENLFIISSDFSHYPSYEDAQRIDELTGKSILKKDPEHFYNTLRKNSLESVPNLSTSTCGWSSIMTMLYMAQRKEDQEISPILYKNSGDAAIGDKERVVGYWAIATHEPVPGPVSYELLDPDKQALLAIARSTLETFLYQGELAEIPSESISKLMKEPAGAFVSLYMGGKLRGCIGNFSPTNPLYMVVQEMTLAAATRDHRFAPVESPELEYISIEISVLTPLRKINSVDEFQLGTHGIYMTKDGKSGTYLPQVADETGWTTEELLGHCAREKAGIGWEGWKDADLYVYEAIVFGEEKLK
jgi:AmmeMemoRadiSam system protein B/AmmeMemoRadiSam system protein A